MLRRLVGAAAAALVLAGTVAGCTSTASKPSAAPSVAAFWKTRIDQLTNAGASTFEKHVFADYTVTDAEYKEAQDLYIQCMADQGWTVAPLDSGGYSITPAEGQDQSKAVPQSVDEKCQDGTIGNIEPIYLGLKYNPQGLNFGQQVRACFEKHGVPDGAGLSDDDFLALVTGPSFVASTPEGELCTQDPLGQQGMTVDEAIANDADNSTASTSKPIVIGSPSSGGDG